MYKLYLVCLILFGISVAACNRQSTVASVLASADSLMLQRPDSSLALLENIPSASLTGKAERAHHSLLLTKARHKNYIDETDDSIINIALKYYRHHGDDSLLMQSLFYKATILYNATNYTKSIVSAMKAEELARELNDNYWIARTCELISDIYTMTYYREEAVNYTIEASKYYLKSGKKANHMYALLDLASCYANLGDYNKSIQLIDSIKNIAYQDHPLDSTFIACCIEASITFYQWNGEYLKSKDAIINFAEFKTHLDLTATDYARITETYLNLGENDSTEKYLNITLSQDQRSLDKIAVQSLLMNYYKNTRNYKKALQYSDSIFALQDSTVHQALQQSVITTQRDLFRIQTKIDHKKVKRLRAYIFTGILFIIILFSFGIAYHKLRIKLKNVEIDRKMNEVFILSEQNKYHEDINNALKNNLNAQSKKITQLTDDLTNQQDKSNRMKSLVENLFLDKWHTINVLCNEFFEKGTSDKTRASIVNDVEKEITKICNPNNLNIIENEVNDCMDDIIEKLHNQCPQFKQEDYTFMMLIYAGFSPRAICLFTNIKLKNFYNKRSRLIERIAKTDAPDKELFITKLRQRSKY